MSIFDALTGDAYTSAGRRNTAAIGTGLAQGTGALQTGANNALGYLFGGPNGAPGALQLTERGYDRARGDVTGQYGATQGYLGQLGSLYQPLVDQGQAAETRYLNATGANGAAGSTQAQSDFRAAPGYQYSQDQALGAVQRSAAARGGLAGGNATQDILRTATGLADQGFQQYVTNLGNASSIYGQGIAGQAAGLGAQAQASQGYGNALSALGTGEAGALSGIYGAGAGVQTGLGQGIAGLTSNATNALVSNNNTVARGQTEASGNALGALTGIASAAFGIPGASTGISNGLGALGRGVGNTVSDAVGFNPFGYG